MLDTSSDKYTVVGENSLDISLNNVTGADGGLYSCNCDGGIVDRRLCVYVYGELLEFNMKFFAEFCDCSLPFLRVCRTISVYFLSK